MTWIQTVSGKAVELIKPDPKTIVIEDIAHALAMQCRYNGHTPQFYSVAQHSVLVSEEIEKALQGVESDEHVRELAFWGLMHDAAEAYVGDLVAPAKQILRQVDDLEFDDMEARIMAVICRKFGMALKQPEIVKEYDLRLLATERRDLFLPHSMCPRDWNLPCPPLDLRIWPQWSPQEGLTRFLVRFDSLGGKR